MTDVFHSNRSAKICSMCQRTAEHVMKVCERLEVVFKKDMDISGIYSFSQVNSSNSTVERNTRPHKRPHNTPTPSHVRASKKQLTSTPRKQNEHSYVRQLTFPEEASTIVENSNPLSTVLSPNLDVTTLLHELYECNSLDKLVDILYKHEDITNGFKTKLILDMEATLTTMCSLQREPGPSVLRTCINVSSLNSESILARAVVELEKTNPFLFSVLRTLCTPIHLLNPKTEHIVAMLYGIGMHSRNNQLSAIQRMVTCSMLTNGAQNDLLRVMHKLGVSLSKDSKLQFISEMGRESTAGIVSSLKRGIKGKVTTDNIDGKITANEIRIVGGSREFHYTASTYLPER